MAFMLTFDMSSKDVPAPKRFLNELLTGSFPLPPDAPENLWRICGGGPLVPVASTD